MKAHFLAHMYPTDLLDAQFFYERRERMLSNCPQIKAFNISNGTEIRFVHGRRPRRLIRRSPRTPWSLTELGKCSPTLANSTRRSINTEGG
jgi:hypothetical protein